MAVIRCRAWREASPFNPAFAWCGRHRIHLDADGRFCRRCRSDPAFRALLRRHDRLRAAAACEGAEAGWCERFGLAVDDDLCARCREDPEYRALLAGQRAPLAATAGCPHRGEVVRREARRCCGGKLREVPVHACARRGEAGPEECLRCAESGGIPAPKETLP